MASEKHAARNNDGRGARDKRSIDNRANQLNPNNRAYWASRGIAKDENGSD